MSKMKTKCFFEPVTDTVVGYNLPKKKTVWANDWPPAQKNLCIEAEYDLPEGFDPLGKNLDIILAQSRKK